MSIVFEGRKVLVIGAGRTGVAVARFLARSRARVVLVDRSPEACAAARTALAGLAVEVRTEDDGVALLDGVELVVPSPGVPRTSPLLVVAVERGLPVRSEIELASGFLGVPVLAVTGTNGKSTTTELLGRMLREAGRRPFVGGNLGTPLVEAIGLDLDCAAVEVSSYQLEWIEHFRPDVGIFLNLTPDHLDRYASLDEYGESKARLFENQGAEDWAVISREDPWVWALRDRLPGRVVSFGVQPVEFGAFGGEGGIQVRLGESTGEGEHRFTMSHSRLRGVHNLENAMAATLAALLSDVPAEVVQKALDEFPGLPHRLEIVRQRAGVAFIDDSKGTNVGAVVRSLQSIAGPIILLAGGVDKGGGYEELRPLVRERVKRLVVFGEAGERIRAALGSETDTVAAGDLDEAVRRAVDVASPGDTVLLSPACASFDMFRDYAERGDRFRAIVEAL